MNLKTLHRRRFLNFVPGQNTGRFAYFKMDGNAVDSYGTKNATFNNATSAGGKIGNALSYDGSTQYTEIPINLSNYSAFSVDWWFKTSQAATGARYMFQHEATATGNGFMVSIENGQIWIRVFGAVSYNGTFNDGLWHHIAINKPAGATTTDVEVYVDTVRLSIATDTQTALNLRSTTLNLGARNPEQRYGGLLDEMDLYSRTRTLQEITDRYNNGNGTTLNTV